MPKVPAVDERPHGSGEASPLTHLRFFDVESLGFKVEGLGFRVEGFGLRVWDSASWVQALELWGLGFRVQGLG